MIERTAVELRQLLSHNEITAEALTGAFLQSIRHRDPKVRAFLHVDEAAALQRADVDLAIGARRDQAHRRAFDEEAARGGVGSQVEHRR